MLKLPEIANQVEQQGLMAGVVCGAGCRVGPAPEALLAKVQRLLERRKNQDFPPPALKEAVRTLLRTGGFKPSGRSKPASEYLAHAARESRFPLVNNLVDINNYVSLESGLPASLLDLDLTTDSLRLRLGRQGEKYLFNSAGQEIDLTDLICVCRASDDLPLGNPVKDAMHAKIQDGTRNVVGVVYAPRAAITEEELQRVLDLFGQMLVSFGGADEVVKVVK